MILKASKRGGAVDLAKHLLKSENEHVEVHEIRGFVSDNVVEAFQEAYAISRGTKCRQFLFSLSLSPPEGESVPVEALESAIASLESRLGLVDQPRVIAFHEKEGRRHAHCAWSRIDAQTMTAIDLPHFKLKLMDISRQLYLEHGWTMPDGMIDPSLRSPLSFDLKEWFQAKRVGQDPRAIKQVLQQCWSASDSGKAFRQALQQRGYFLARGDRRAVVAVDVHGEVYAVSRWIGVRSKDVVARMGDIEALPSVDTQKQVIAQLMRDKLAGFARNAIEEFAVAAQASEAKRLAMVERHRSVRRDLRETQQGRWKAEALLRAERFRKGLLGLWDRVTGQHGKLRQQNERETIEAAQRDAADKQVMVKLQLEERQRLQREIKQVRALHLHQVTRLTRHIAGYNWDDGPQQGHDEAGEGSVRPRQRRRHEPSMSGP